MRFDLNGYNIDNLLKTLYLKKITLNNVVRTSRDSLSFEVSDKDARKVKRHLANFKVVSTLSLSKRLPKIILANIGILIGVLIGVIFGVIASHYTWRIDVFGVEELSTSDIIQVLKENDISVGKINSQSSDEIEAILMNNYDRIAQVSVIRRGTSIIINLSEKLVYIEEEFKPIVAKYNGIIREIKVITGTVNVKAGDYVNIGDILVLPYNISSNGDRVSVQPMAEIIGEIYVIGRAEMNRIETTLVRSGNTKTVYKYKIFNFELFTGKNKNSFALFDLVSYNENVSGLIPLTRDVYVYHELVSSEVMHDFDTERDALLDESVALAYQDLPVGEILDEEREVRVVGDTMFACTTIKILGNINDTN